MTATTRIAAFIGAATLILSSCGDSGNGSDNRTNDEILSDVAEEALDTYATPSALMLDFCDALERMEQVDIESDNYDEVYNEWDRLGDAISLEELVALDCEAY